MRILVVTNLYPLYHLGGCGMICYRICRLLAKRGHQIHVITSDPGDLRASGMVAETAATTHSSFLHDRAIVSTYMCARRRINSG